MTLLDYAKDIFINPNKYQKFWIAVVGASVSALSVTIPDSPYLTVIVNFVTAIGVFAVPNKGVK